MGRGEGEIVAVPVDLDDIARVDPSLQQRGRQRVGQPLLDDSLEWPGPVHWVEPFLGQPLLGRVADFQSQLGLGELCLETPDLDVDDLLDFVPCPADGR